MIMDIMQNVDALFTRMEDFTQKEGLIGKPVTHSDKTFLPIVSVAVGFGGGDSKTKNQSGQSNATTGMTMGSGASGLGAKLCTDAVLIIDKNNVMIAPVGSPSNMSQIIDKVPQIVSNMTSSGQQQGGQQQGGQQQASQQNQQQNKQ